MQLGEGMVSRTYLQNGIVSKQYFTPFQKYSERSIQYHWEKEIKALNLLKGKKHFPQLISVDHANRIIYMSYCGDALTKKNLPKDWKKQCKEIQKTLSGLNIHPQDFKDRENNPIFPHQKNIHVLKGIIYVIDFGIWADKHSKNLDSVTEVLKKVANYKKK